MDIDSAVSTLMRSYPKIYFACHRRHVRDPKSGAELSAHQASILDHLDAVQPTLVRELAEHLGVTASTMSIHLDRLEAGGYVVRKRDREDSRKVQVTLTAAGLRIRSANSVLDPELVRGLVRSLSPEDRRDALAGLVLLAQAAERLPREK